jgi:hypothetical protein
MDLSLIKPSWLLSHLGPARPRFSGDALAPFFARHGASSLLRHLLSLWPSLADPPLPFALVKQRVLLSLLTLRSPWGEGVEAAARELVAEALRSCCPSGGDSAARLQLIGAALALALRPCVAAVEGSGAGGDYEATRAREAEAAACLAAAVGNVARCARARLAAARAGGLGGAGSAPPAPPRGSAPPHDLTDALRLCAITGARGIVGGARAVHPALNRWTAGLSWEALPLEARLGVASAELRGALRSCGVPGGPAALAGGGGGCDAAGVAPPSRDFFLAATAHAANTTRERLLSRALQASDTVLQAGGEGDGGGEGDAEHEGGGGGEGGAAAAAELSAALGQIAALLRPGLEAEAAELEAAERARGAGSGLLAGRGGGAAAAPRATDRVHKRPREAALLVEEEEGVGAEEEEGAGGGARGGAAPARRGAGAGKAARGGGGGEGGGAYAAAASAAGGAPPAPSAQSSDRLLALLGDAPLLDDAARATVTAFAAGRNKLDAHPRFSAALAAAAAEAAAAEAAARGGAGEAPGGTPPSPMPSAAAATRHPGLPPGASAKLQFELRQEVASSAVGGIGGGGGGGGDAKVMCVVLELDFSESKWRCFRKRRDKAAKR